MKTTILVISIFTFISSCQSDAQLPRNYYPWHQKLDLTLSSQDTIIGSTLIFIGNTYNLSNEPVVFNAYKRVLKVRHISLFEGWGDPNSLQKIPSDDIIYHNNAETYTVRFEGNYSKIALHIHFKAKVSGWSKERFGVFPIYYDYYKDRSAGLATQFEQSFARKAFPCFDDPYFRTVYELKMTLASSGLENSSNANVFFNSPLKTFDPKKMEYTFEKTIPIPSYLVAFAVIDVTKHKLLLKMSYFGTPITLYGEQKDFYGWKQKDFDKIEEVIRFTLSFCESKFLVPLDLKKIDMIVIEMPDSKIGAMEHPGLMTINSVDIDNLLPTLIHEIIHQWTGVKILNDWWSGFWMNEGFTTFFQGVIQYHLVRFKRIDSQILDTTFYARNYRIHGNAGGVAKLGADGFKQLTYDFYCQSANAAGLLHIAMNDLLMKCLGLIMKMYPYSSLSTDFILEELTECPFSELNVTEFMSFWLFEDQTPILTVEYVTEKGQSFLNFHYNFLKPIAEMKNRFDLYDEFPKTDPRFAVVFRDPLFNIIQPMTVVSDNSTKVPAAFALTEYKLFFINALVKGNFINRYPRETYNAFFNWLSYDETVDFIANYATPKHYSFFILDMFILGYRRILEPDLFFRLLESQKSIRRLGDELWQTVEIIPKFATCLNWDMDAFLEENDKSELRKLLRCYVCKIAAYSHCDTGFTLIDSCQNWVRLYGMQFVEDLKSRMIQNTDEFSKCLSHEGL